MVAVTQGKGIEMNFVKQVALATAAVALAAVATLTYGQASVTGYWDFRAPRTANNDGTYRETFFELKQSGETISGRVEPGGRARCRLQAARCAMARCIS
jgi:hypothetical protein